MQSVCGGDDSTWVNMTTSASNPSLFRLLAFRGRRIAAAGGLMMLGLLSSGTAVAAPAQLTVKLEPRLVGPVHWTATSGETSALETILQPRENRSGYAAQLFSWTERSDSPCWAKLRFRPLGDDDFTSTTLENCDEHPASNRWVGRLGENEVITGIEICLTDKSSSALDRLKGVKLWGRAVNLKTGELGSVEGPSSAQRKRCKRKGRRVFCPSGEVAAKFKVYSQYNASRDDMQGISLGCRKIEMRPSKPKLARPL